MTKRSGSNTPPDKLLVLMSDTGDEHDHTYEHIDEVVRPLCAKHNIFFDLITNDMGFHSQAWLSLNHQYEKNNTIGSAAYPQSCTGNLKVNVIDRYVSAWLSTIMNVKDYRKNPIKSWAAQNGKIKLILGFAADEDRGNSKHDPVWKKESMERVYPLKDWGWSRHDCQEYIREREFDVPYPSNCLKCFYMSDLELIWLHRNYPHVFDRWVKQERAKLDRFGGEVHAKNLGVFGKQTLREKLNKAMAKHPEITDDELNKHKMSHGHCVKSKY
jgi:hypothetical protein